MLPVSPFFKSSSPTVLDSVPVVPLINMQSINNTGESIREALGNRGMDSAESMYYFNANRRYGGHFEEEVWQSLLGQPDRVGQVGVPFL